MLAKLLCWLLGHQHITKNHYMGVTMGRTETIRHIYCPRCGEYLLKGSHCDDSKSVSSKHQTP